MMGSNLHIMTLVLGPLQTNTYLLCDREEGVAVVIDPASGAEDILAEVKAMDCTLSAIWVTHAHFDHIGAVSDLQDACGGSLDILVHEADLPLWEERGGADRWGIQGYRLVHQPTKLLKHGEALSIGPNVFEVRHTPGHSQGHVIFISDELQAVFCGDLIFQEGVGRTDLPGGSWASLVRSIREQVLTLPDSYRLFPGHGEATSVGHERSSNPFLPPGRDIL